MKSCHFRRLVLKRPVAFRAVEKAGDKPLLSYQISYFPQDFWEEDPELRTYHHQPNDAHCAEYRKQKHCEGETMMSSERNPKEYLYARGMHWINPDQDVRERKFWYDSSIIGDVNTVWRPENENTVLNFNQEMTFMAFQPSDIHHEVDYESEDADVEIISPRECMHNRTAMSWWWRAIMWGTFGFIVCVWFPWIVVKLEDSTMMRCAKLAPNFDQEDLTQVNFFKTPEGKALVEMGLLKGSSVDIDNNGNRIDLH